jgi:predicted AlkP superfamily phosphohydrolase/phosphomutase/tetratricopeptide (TPR) repeat protein
MTRITPEPGRKLLMVGWDAADWKVIHPLLDAGQMPHLQRLIEHGVMGDLRTMQPVLSPMLWNSIATGHRAERHGILGFSEVDEEARAVRPVSSLSRRVKALWNIFSQLGLRTHVFNWYASHPAEPVNGVCVTDAYAHNFPAPGEPFPLTPGTVHPEHLAETFAELRLRPEEIDESIIKLFVPRAEEVDQQNDRRLAMIAKLVAESVCVHNALTWTLEHQDWDFAAAYYPGIDHFSHGFMNFHPPRPPWVDEKLFDLYQDVVNGAYRFHDLMLGRLVQLAGPEATVMVLSDHGFHSDHLRPRILPKAPAGPAAQHRTHGIFVMAGPGIKADARIDGAGLPGITPTVLTLFGLPIGQDMPGRPLLEAFDPPRQPEFVPSWEEIEGPHPDGTHPPGTSYGLDKKQSRALVEHFVALGYLDPLGDDAEQALERTRQEQAWCLAQSHIAASQHAEAADILTELVAQRPERGDFILALAECLAQLRFADEAELLVNALLSDRPAWPSAQYLRGSVHLLKNEFDEALARFSQAAESGFDSATLQMQIGYAYRRLGRHDDAYAAFSRATQIDPHLAWAHVGRAASALALGRPDDAASHALDAAALQYNLAVAHLLLGLAMERLGRREDAVRAYQVAVAVNPRLGIAHWRLGTLLLRTPETAAQGAAHRTAARRARKFKREQLDRRRARAAERHAKLEAALAKARPAWRKAEKERIARENAAKQDKTAGEPVIVVSGLPRSGTSLMMQMLQAAGVPILTDHERRPDDDNPEGYLEWEPIKTIARHPERIAEAEGKAVKVISMLLPALPPERRYKVLFMMRPVSEVAASQAKMLERRGTEGLPPDETVAQLRTHRDGILAALSRSRNMKTLRVPYPQLLAKPDAWIRQITEFLGPGRIPHPEAMPAAIRPDLHRQKGGEEENS